MSIASATIYKEAFLDGLRPDKQMSVTEYADEFRILSGVGAAEAGPYRSDRTPYLKEIMDCLSPSHPCQKVVFQKGSQIGGSEAGFNFIGFIIDRAPGPTMMVQPSVGLAERVSKQRIQPMIEACPTLKDKISRSKGNTILSKEFPGGVLIMTGANSAAGLRSMPVKYLMLDEVDAYPRDVDGEGSAVDLAEKRTATFSRKKIFAVSSPTIKGESEIEAQYLSSDRRRFLVPCPHCGERQWLKWAQVKWAKLADGAPDLKSVRYECEHCEKEIEEHNKSTMLAAGEWVAENPSSPIPGFHLSALYSPLGWESWRSLVDAFYKAQGKPKKLQVFINTALGETYEIKTGDAPDWKKLYNRRELYKPGTVPYRACLLTASVDVQKDRLECKVVGWNRAESWVVDLIVLPGDTSKPITEAPWTDLDRVLDMKFQHVSGRDLTIERAAIDTGYNTNRVYEYVRARGQRNLIAIKGKDSLPMPISIPKGVDVKATANHGKKIRRGVRLWQVGTNLLKAEIYGRLRREMPTDKEIDAVGFPIDFVHFPQLDEEYFKQLTAEQQQLVTNRDGHDERRWVKTYHANEALDLMVYNVAVYYQLGAHRWKKEQWKEREAMLGITGRKPAADSEKPVDAPPPAPPATVVQPKKPKTRRDSGYW